MHSFILLTGELLVTQGTGERLFSRVKSVVCSESFLLLESHGTNVTLERIILQVSVDMSLEFNLVPEQFAAVFTGEGTLSLMDGADVFVKRPLLTKLLLAERTNLRLHIAMESDVTSKGFLLKRQSTDWTCCHLRSDTKVIEKMIDQSFVIFELLLLTEETEKIIKIIAASNDRWNLNLLSC